MRWVVVVMEALESAWTICRRHGESGVAPGIRVVILTVMAAVGGSGVVAGDGCSYRNARVSFMLVTVIRIISRTSGWWFVGLGIGRGLFRTSTSVAALAFGLPGVVNATDFFGCLDL